MSASSWPPLDPEKPPAQQIQALDANLRQLRKQFEGEHSATVHLTQEQHELLLWALDLKRAFRLMKQFGKAGLAVAAVLIVALSGWDKVVAAAQNIRSLLP